MSKSSIIFVYLVFALMVSCVTTVKTLKKPPIIDLKAVTFEPASPSDEALISTQKHCPVGELLGSMGNPIKVTVGSSFVFLCCDGCIPYIKKNPEFLRYDGAIYSFANDNDITLFTE